MGNRTVYLNGRYLPLNEATVSVLDRGFLFGDGVYEVIPSYYGHLFHFDEHMARLENSLSGIRVPNPHTGAQWLGILKPLLDPALNQYVYLQVTRGAGEKRDHAFPEAIQPTVFAMSSTIVPLATQNSGIRAVTMEDSRWRLCHIKAITLLANVLFRQEAVDRDCTEAILVREDRVTEGAASNVFAVIDGVLVTPPKSNEILPGITRDVVLEIAKMNHITSREESISLTSLRNADEIWLTSSTREIMPVIELDSRPVGNGRPGPLWQTMNRLFQSYKASLQ
ncbi:MAG: D-amino acid aminotransferase [Gammaproteobacteria bacterium]